MSHEILKYFSNLIEKETGIIFQDTNLYQLQSRLDDFIKLEKISSLNDLYNEFLKNSNFALKQRLLDISTNNETLFFRDPGFFAAIEEYLVTEVLPKYPSEIKIWSAASSTGQEAISVAIALEELSQKRVLPPYSIIATDISERALSKGKAGIYSEFEVMRGLSTERRDKFFFKVDGGWQVKASIHNKIKYSYNNLTRSTVVQSFHIILCRNVLIYQNIETKKTVVNTLFSHLEPNGGLMLGVGETLLGIMEDIVPVMKSNVAFYRTKKNSISQIA